MDETYVLDMRGLLYPGDRWNDLNEMYHDSLRAAGIDPQSLPLIDKGLTRYVTGMCTDQLWFDLRRARTDGYSIIDICDWQSRRGFPREPLEIDADLAVPVLHPACPRPELDGEGG
jgi:hypothetical protein